MKLQRIVSQSPAEDFDELTAEAPQRSRQDPVASVSSVGGEGRTTTTRGPRKFSRGDDDDGNDKQGYTSGGGYATRRSANNSAYVETGAFVFFSFRDSL